MKGSVAGVVVLWCFVSMNWAEAQQTGTYSTPGGLTGQPLYSGGVIQGGGSIGPVVLGEPGGGQVSYAGSTVGQRVSVGQQLADYSYWVAFPGPARTYVPYGSLDQFPFQGRPYGSPNDRWSWYYMGGGNGRYLARYYYPLLP